MRTRIHSLIFSTLIIFSLSYSMQVNAQPHLTEALEAQISDAIPAEYFETAKQHAEEIFTTCPPTDCVLVSFGFTNTLLDSFLRVMMEKNKVPDSYLRYMPVKNLKESAFWNEETDLEFYKKMLPSVEEVQGKTVMFTRTLLSGMTVNQIFPAIREHYESQGFSGKLGSFLIVDSVYTAKLAESAQSQFEKLSGINTVKVDLSYSMFFGTRKVIVDDDSDRPNFHSDYEDFYRYKEILIKRTDTTENNNWQLIESENYLALDEYVANSKLKKWSLKNLLHRLKMKTNEECLRLVNFR